MYYVTSHILTSARSGSNRIHGFCRAYNFAGDTIASTTQEKEVGVTRRGSVLGVIVTRVNVGKKRTALYPSTIKSRNFEIV